METLKEKLKSQYTTPSQEVGDIDIFGGRAEICVKRKVIDVIGGEEHIYYMLDTIVVDITLKEKVEPIVERYVMEANDDMGDRSEVEEDYLVNVLDFPIEDWDYENEWDEFDEARNGMWLFAKELIIDYVIDCGELPVYNNLNKKWCDKIEAQYTDINLTAEWVDKWLMNFTSGVYVESTNLYGDEAIPYINGLIKETIREHQLDMILV